MEPADLDIDPQQAIQAGRHLADVGERLADLRHTGGAAIESVNDTVPWGRDEVGAAFASGYAESAAHVLQAWKEVADRTRQLGEEIVHGARSAVTADDATADVLRRLDG